MDRPLTRDDLLDVLESSLSAQLRAVRASRRGSGTGGRRGRRVGKKSNMSIVQDILTASGQPLHINDIIVWARRDHGVELKRESIVSALTKKVLDGNTFCRAGRNVFGLLGKEQG
jgi:hypothetical protein